jgi:hypothetical protein
VFGYLKTKLFRGSETSRLVKFILKVLLYLYPFQSVNRVREDAKTEWRKLKLDISVLRSKSVVVRYDTRHSFPGMGDLFLLVMLANYFSALGFSAIFSTNAVGSNLAAAQSKNRNEEYLALIEVFLSPDVTLRYDSELEQRSDEYVVLGERVSREMDISAVSLLLMSRVFNCGTLNPLRVEPLVKSFSPFAASLGREADGSGPSIGIHVRASSHASSRNPSFEVTKNDCLGLLDRFPGARLVWFGEKSMYERFREEFDLSEDSRSRIVYQQSEGFAQASLEALKMDFWFQRLGGGIGAVRIFSEKPYIFLSGDSIATRYYSYRGKRVCPWAGINQFWFLLLADENQSIAKFLKSLHKDLLT